METQKNKKKTFITISVITLVCLLIILGIIAVIGQVRDLMKNDCATIEFYNCVETINKNWKAIEGREGEAGTLIYVSNSTNCLFPKIHDYRKVCRVS